MLPLFSSNDPVLAVCGAIIAIELGSFVLNLLILSRATHVPRRNLSHTLTFLICATDLLLSLDVLAKYGLRLGVGRLLLLENMWVCHYLWTTCYVLTCLSSVLISLLAMERYLRVCRGMGVPPQAALAAMTVALLVFLVLGVMTSLTDGFLVDSSGVFCILSASPWPSALSMAVKTTFFASLLTIVGCYCGIYRFCRRHSEDFASRIQPTKTLLPIVVYSVTFAPVFAQVLAKLLVGAAAVPKVLVILSFVSAVTIPAANSFLVVFLHHQIRESLATLFRKPKAIRLTECSRA